MARQTAHNAGPRPIELEEVCYIKEKTKLYFLLLCIIRIDLARPKQGHPTDLPTRT